MVDNQVNITTLEIEDTSLDSVNQITSVTGDLTNFVDIDITPNVSGVDPNETPTTTVFYDFGVTTSGGTGPITVNVLYRSVRIPENLSITDFSIISFFQDAPTDSKLHVFQRTDGHGLIIYDLFLTFSGAAGTIDYTLQVASLAAPGPFDNPFVTVGATTPIEAEVFLRHRDDKLIYDVFLLTQNA